MRTEEEDDDREGMEDAVDRARESGGQDVFNVLDEPEGEMELPELDLSQQAPQGVSDSPPPTPPPEELPDLPDPKAALAKAFTSPGQTQAAERMQEIASRRYKPSAGLSDDAIAKARADRRAAIGRNDFTRAIQAALLRKPFNPTDPEDEAGDLLQQRAREESQFNLNNRNEMSAQAALAKALRGEKAGGLTEFQKYQIERQKQKDAAAASKPDKTATSDQAWRDSIESSGLYDELVAKLKAAGKWDTLGQKEGQNIIHGVEADRGRKASIQAAREGRAFTVQQTNEKDAQELAGKLGDPAVFQSKYDELMKLVKDNGGQVPGLGTMEGLRQKPGLIGSAVRAVSPPTAASIKGRKLLSQLAQGYAHEISGAGVSDKERQTINAALVDVDNDDSAIALAGLETLKGMHEAKVSQLKRGYKPEVVNRVAPPQAPAAPGGETKTGKDGKQYRKNANGKWEAVGG